MNFVASIAGPIIYTRYEPITGDEWKAFDSPGAVRAEDCEPFGAWVAFFVIRKSSITAFSDSLGAALEEVVGDLFTVSTLAAARYVYVLAAADIQEIDANLSLQEDFDTVSQRLWTACMRIAKNHEFAGCTLFGPKAFIDYDRQRAEALLAESLDITLTQPK